MTDLREAFACLDTFIEREMRTANTPGLVAALTDRERLLHIAAHGFADLAARAPVTPDTLFEIGSISKSFTAIALLQLREAGRLDLHLPVRQYLPWFHVPSKYAPITLHHLLSHTAGIIRGTDFTTEARCEVWALRQTEASTPPGAHYHYSNVGYKALGLIPEEILGRSYGDIIQERILDPLGMSATESVITHKARKRLAVGYEPFYDDRPVSPDHTLAPATWLETATADGSIASTGGDMAAYLRMLMNGGRGVFSEESFRLMTQRVTEPDDEVHGTFYGYGLNINQDDDHTCISHGGGMVGYYAHILADMEAGLGVVVLTNGLGEPGTIAQFALQLLRAALGGHGLPPLPPVSDPTRTENAADYAGTYRAEARTLVLADEGERLVMRYGDERIPLEEREADCLYVPHPDFERFLLRFQRREGQVVEAFHGPDWYVNDRYTGSTIFDHPPEWTAYPGHYRSHNPWYGNFRVVLRKGALMLIEPRGDEQMLVPLGSDIFRVGEDERSPERIRFDTIINGQAVRANLSCCDYYRTFTP
jgi:D-alanyl-D-alanine carboxypeptidase